jgi:hypothetical protein
VGALRANDLQCLCVYRRYKIHDHAVFTVPEEQLSFCDPTVITVESNLAKVKTRSSRSSCTSTSLFPPVPFSEKLLDNDLVSSEKSRPFRWPRAILTSKHSCPICANMLLVRQGDEDSDYRFSCRTCPYIYPIRKQASYTLSPIQRGSSRRRF